MRADLDLLCISVYCTADDLLPARPRNGRRKLTDAEIVTLCVAQVLMGSRAIGGFCGRLAGSCSICSRSCRARTRLHKRSQRLTEAIEWLTGVVAAQSPGYDDDLVLLDSTPVECGRSLETTRRSDLAEVCGHGYCKSHSRWFWGMRLHLVCAPDGTPRAATLVAADRPEREVALPLLARALHGGETVVCDKGYAGREFGRRRQRARRHDHPTRPQKRARQRPPPRPDPAADRVHLLSPAKTCSASNATAPAPPPTSEPASPPDCSRSPPASGSTTNSDSQAAHSPTTPPNPVASII